MNKQTEHDTREHLLATGEQLCMQRGFTGMGLSELLKTARCLKGRFITTFARKKPSASPCLSDITPAIISVLRCTSPPVPVIIAIVFSRYQETLKQFCQQGAISGCLTVKLSAEVCDLSEDMRSTMDKGRRRSWHCLHARWKMAVIATVYISPASRCHRRRYFMPCGWAPICRQNIP